VRGRIYGEGHLADVLRCELELWAGYSEDGLGQDVLGFVAEDITDHEPAQLGAALRAFERARAHHRTVVVLSQVPPGWMRSVVKNRAWAYYQVDTIIVRSAVERMMRPEQIIVGCADPSAPLSLEYQSYLALHSCPVLQMTYESAELAKCGVNYVLAKQIEAANELARAAGACGADYAQVMRALRGDSRIGSCAYLRPGGTNQHLDRDVATICKVLEKD